MENVLGLDTLDVYPKGNFAEEESDSSEALRKLLEMYGPVCSILLTTTTTCSTCSNRSHKSEEEILLELAPSQSLTQALTEFQ